MPPFSFGSGHARSKPGHVISAPLPGSGRDPVEDAYAVYFSGPSGHPGGERWAPPSHGTSELEVVRRAALEERRDREAAWHRQAQRPDWEGELPPITPSTHRPIHHSPSKGKLRSKREERELRRREAEEEEQRELLRSHEQHHFVEHSHRSAPMHRPRPSAESERIIIDRDQPPVEQKWTTRSTEPLALMKLTNLAKTLSSPSQAACSPMSLITHFSLDLAASDTPSDYLPIAALVLSHLRHLTTLRFVGPRHSKRPLPTSIVAALANSGARLASLGLSRMSSVEGGRALERVGEHLIELKLNDCDASAWSSLLSCMRAPVNVEGLAPPEDLTWFTPRQWRSLKSLRLGHGTPSVLAEVLSSAVDADEQADIRPELDSLILSHFEPPLGLPLLIRIARSFGSTSVRKLELGSIRSEIWSPRCCENLAAYFTKVQDLRIHVLPTSTAGNRSRQGEPSLARGRAVAADWTADGEYDMSSYATSLAAFPLLRTIELNHSPLPHLLPLTRSPDVLADQQMATVRILAARCRRLRRVGYSYPVASHFCDVVIDRTREDTRLIEHWSKAPSSEPARDSGR